MRASDPDVTPEAVAEQARLLPLLVHDGFITRVGEAYRPALRWHAALARAAKELHARGEELTDLRVPVAWVVAEQYRDCTERELATLVWLLWRIVATEPSAGAEAPR